MATTPPATSRPTWAYAVPKIAPSTYTNVSGLLRFLILATISAAAVSSRLFAVIRHESIIHELYVAPFSPPVRFERAFGQHRLERKQGWKEGWKEMRTRAAATVADVVSFRWSA
jgi:hypothetical protein